MVRPRPTCHEFGSAMSWLVQSTEVPPQAGCMVAGKSVSSPRHLLFRIPPSIFHCGGFDMHGHVFSYLSHSVNIAPAGNRFRVGPVLRHHRLDFSKLFGFYEFTMTPTGPGLPGPQSTGFQGGPTRKQSGFRKPSSTLVHPMSPHDKPRKRTGRVHELRVENSMPVPSRLFCVANGQLSIESMTMSSDAFGYTQPTWPLCL